MDEQTINWKETGEKDKTRLILDRIMQWPCFETFDAYHRELWKTGDRVDVGYPVTYWSDQRSRWFVFYQPEENPSAFDPLHDLNAAWSLVEKLDVPASFDYDPGSPAEPGTKYHRTHCYECEIGYADWLALDPHASIFRAYADTAAEAICVAALRKIGLHITNVMKEQIPAWRVTLEDGRTLIRRTHEEAQAEYDTAMRRLQAIFRSRIDGRKLRIEETRVPEDYWNGIPIA